jgi:endogenous inhibitor of DNA gyrase (YacG/DUF329 family)
MREIPDRLAGKPDPERARTRRCPICGKPAVAAFRLFCSQRCADVDLNRWLGGVYAIPAAASDEDEPDAPIDDHDGA